VSLRKYRGWPSDAPGRPDGSAPQSDVRNALPGDATQNITPGEDERYSRFGADPRNEVSGGNRPFFSALTRGIEALKQAKGAVQQWLGILKGLAGKGVKAEEIAWSGVEDWLKSQSGPVTKEQLLAWLRANEVHVEEVTKGAPEGGWSRERWAQYEFGQSYFDLDEDARRWVDRMTEPELPADKEPKFSSYQLPGGENYRELLLTLPTESETPTWDKAETNVPFQGGHFDEPNVVAHVRFKRAHRRRRQEGAVHRGNPERLAPEGAEAGVSARLGATELRDLGCGARDDVRRDRAHLAHG
jgi:hypothetical protein